MFVTRLTLADFRSYEYVDLEFDSGVTVFVGRNGQGKTNLVEAIEYLGTLRSHRVASDVPLIRMGAQRAVVKARVQAGLDDDRTLDLELTLNSGRPNSASLNRAPLRRPRELLGALRVVLFAPDDLALIKGDPAERRRFLDDLVVQRWPRLAGVRADYDRVVRQRSVLLKSLAGRRGRIEETAAATLDVWDDQLAGLGAEIVHARLATMVDMAAPFAEAYLAIAPTNNLALAVYRSSSLGLDPAPGEQQQLEAEISELKSQLAEQMKLRRSEEISRGACLVGPHRDDLLISLGDLPAKGYASHGESWSLALSLRLASYAVLRGDGVEPVLILDDVFAELDEVRRQRLGERVRDADQLFVTAAVESDVPDLLGSRIIEVRRGEVVVRE